MSPEKIQFNVSFGPAGESPRDPDAPFALAVVGDFSGRANRSVSEPIAQRRVWRVDCDNFETVLGKLGAALRLPLAHEAGAMIDLRFASVDDFHPDKLLQQVASLAALLAQRKRLLDPAS